MHCRGVVSVLPKRPAAILAAVEFLSDASGKQLHRAGDGRAFAVCIDQEVNMVGGRNIVEDRETVTFPGLKQPHHPSPSIADELEEETTPMVPVCEVPDMTGNEISVCSGHSVNLSLAL